MPRRILSTDERFWPKVQITPGCWEWTGWRMSGGYGVVLTGADGRRTGAHRASYEIHHGAVPPGMEVRHRCDNPPCVNPDHLEVGTHAENMRDMRERGRSRGGAAGPKNGRAKLTAEQVRIIRTTPVRHGINNEFARAFGVNPQYVSMLRNGLRHWTDGMETA